MAINYTDHLKAASTKADVSFSEPPLVLSNWYPEAIPFDEAVTISAAGDTVSTKISRYITKRVKKAVRERDENKCVMCGEGHPGMLDFDHAIPPDLGGSGEECNVQLLCRKCNGKKGQKIWWGPTLRHVGIKLFGSEEALEQAYYRQCLPIT